MARSSRRCCRHTTLEGAQAIAERLLDAVHQRPALLASARQVAYTLSLGVAAAAEMSTVHELMSAADGALYVAKSQGRDRSIVATQAARSEPSSGD